MIPTLQTCAPNNFRCCSSGAERRVERAQTRERGPPPPSNHSEVLHGLPSNTNFRAPERPTVSCFSQGQDDQNFNLGPDMRKRLATLLLAAWPTAEEISLDWGNFHLATYWNPLKGIFSEKLHIIVEILIFQFAEIFNSWKTWPRKVLNFSHVCLGH